jgi:hypothetical protein
VLNSSYSPDEPKSIRSIAVHNPIPNEGQWLLPSFCNLSPPQIISAIYCCFHGACLSLPLRPHAELKVLQHGPTVAQTRLTCQSHVGVAKSRTRFTSLLYLDFAFLDKPASCVVDLNISVLVRCASGICLAFFTGCGCDRRCFPMKFWWHL